MRRLRAALDTYLGGLPATFWWLWVGVFISSLASFVFPFLAVFLTSRGLSPARVGLVSSVFGAGFLVSGPLGGWCADHLGRRPTILGGLALAGVSAAALAFADVPAAIAALVFAYGVSTGMRPAAMATISDVVEPERRARALGLVYWGENVGVGVAFLAGGLLARRGWALPFLLDAATTLAFAAVVWRRVPETRPALPTRGDDPGGARFTSVFRDRPFTIFIVLHVAFGFVFWQFAGAAAIDMTRRGFSAVEYGAVLFVNTALITVVQPFAVRFTERFAAHRVLAAASAFLALGYGAYALCATPVQFAVATTVWSLGEAAYMPTAGALVAGLAPADQRGRYMGTYSLGFGLAAFAAPLLGPAILQAYGAPVLWLGCLAVGTVAAVGFAWLDVARG